MKRFASRHAPLGPILLAGLAWLVPSAGGRPALAQPPVSSSFVLSQSTVNTGGATAVSPSFVLDGSAAQKGTVGEASSGSFVLESGFWNSLSALDVLRVAGAGSGRGTVAATGISCDLAGGVPAGDCLEPVRHGTTAELVAVADAGSRFDGWTGCDATSTSSLPGDTCRVTLRESRTVVAGLTLLGTVGDRVWIDLDGDGLQGGGEPGVDGVEVTLSDGGAVSETATTAGGGLYAFADVAPGSYTVSVDPTSLPPGAFPTFDADGTATPHAASITLAGGDALAGVDFGYQPLADLAITKEASAETLPASGRLTYTITVHNLGPAAATGVVVTDLLPAGLTLVGTAGCVEDPAGVPTCTLGDLAPGTLAGFTIEVAADPHAQPALTNTASVAATEADPVATNDAAAAVTGATPLAEIPTASSWALLLLAILLVATGAWKLR